MIAILVIVKVQGKFQMSLGAEGNHNPHHGIRVEVAWDFHNHCHIKGSINIITIAIINTSIALNCFRPPQLWCWMHSATLASRWMIILTNVVALELYFESSWPPRWIDIVKDILNWHSKLIFWVIMTYKVIATSGDLKEYLWTLERNLDADHQFKSLEESYRE